MEDNIVQIRERLTVVEESCKSAHKRIDKQETILENIRNIVEEIRFMREDLNSVTKKVDELEKQPAKRWDLIITAVISAGASGLIGFIISKIIGG